MTYYERVRLSEVATVRGGKRLPAGKDFVATATAHPYIRARDIGGGKVAVQDAVYLDEETAKRLSRYTVNQGDVCLTIVGANVGEMGAVPLQLDGANLTENAVKIVTNGKADQTYLKFALLSDEAHGQMKVLAGGAAQPKLGIYKIETIEIPLPPLPTQQRIAGILSAYDELIENSQRRIKILETMARAIYREWFVHFRFPGSENHPRVASALGEIPQGWEVKKVGEIADTFRGRSYRSVDLAEDGGLPFLNLKCLDRDGGFRRSGLKRYTGEYKDGHIARKGDIIMAVTDMTQDRRIVARAAMVPSLDKEFGIISMDLVGIKPKASVPKDYLYAFLRYSSFADEVKQHANGANVLHLSPERITEFRFPVPTVQLMERFAAFVAPVLEQINALENKQDNLRRTRDLLLPRLLSGQINVEAAS